MSYSSLAVEGDTLPVIYAGGQPTHRKERISTNSGMTWRAAVFVFGCLHSQAIGDGVAWDALGRLHFLLRFAVPRGIYHAYWDQGKWYPPALIYLIAWEFESIGDRIHAHRVRSAIRAGNQVVLTFTTSPGDPQSILYIMQTVLQDVTGLPAEPLPTWLPTAAPKPSADTVSLIPLPVSSTAPTHFKSTLEQTPINTSSPADVLAISIIPVLIFVVGLISFRILIKRS